jgi:DNA invertase Pin-like site-specific DNA recombinase
MTTGRPTGFSNELADRICEAVANSQSGLRKTLEKDPELPLCSARAWEIIAPPFTEVESGKRSDRPELIKALERCKVTGATLVVAKLDRLSRDAVFLLTLQNSGAPFVAADMPDANNFTVGIMALVAQQEREAISSRTKAALAAAKARGQRLGNPNGAAALRRAGKGTAAALHARQRNADEHAARLRPIIARMHGEGHTSLGALAKALNEEGMVTPRGARWHASSVRNLLARLSAPNSLAQG